MVSFVQIEDHHTEEEEEEEEEEDSTLDTIKGSKSQRLIIQGNMKGDRQEKESSPGYEISGNSGALQMVSSVHIEDIHTKEVAEEEEK